MSQQLPKVSVIIAAYNNSKYLREAVESALLQDYPNTDIYLVDDASTEYCYPEFLQDIDWNFVDFSERLEEIDKIRLHFINNKNLYYIRLRNNGGPSRARNIAIANAMKNGSHLFQILDSDDKMYPNKISKLIEPILNDPERIAFSYADYIIQGQDGVCRYESKPCYDYMRFFGGDCHVHSGSLVNGLAIKEFFPYFYPENQRVTEDYYMFRKVLRSTQWLAYHQAIPLTLVRSHDLDSTNSVKKEIWEQCYRRTMTET